VVSTLLIFKYANMQPVTKMKVIKVKGQPKTIGGTIDLKRIRYTARTMTLQ